MVDKRRAEYESWSARKGAFILTSDGKRKSWKVSGPLFHGWEVYHMAGSPADPDRIYASQTSGWFGQVIQRSDDGGKTWETPGGGPEKGPDGMPRGESNKFVYEGAAGTHLWYDGTPRPWEFKRVWHLEPSLTIPTPSTPASRTPPSSAPPTAARPGRNCPACAVTPGPKWQPGAGGLCLHTILIDPTNPKRIFIAISAAGSFRTDDGGKTWKPINHGLRSSYIPDPDAEVGHCVHRLAMHPSRPNTLFMQKHWDVMRTDDAGDTWHEISGNLPTDFGFATDCLTAHEPETIYVVPIVRATLGYFPPEVSCARVSQSRTGCEVHVGAHQRSAATGLLRQRLRGHGAWRLARTNAWATAVESWKWHPDPLVIPGQVHRDVGVTGEELGCFRIHGRTRVAWRDSAIAGALSA